MKTIAALASALSISLSTLGSAYAFDMPKIAGVTSSSSSAPAESAGQVVSNSRNAILSFAMAKIGLLSAMGGYENLSAQREILKNMKTGDATASKEELETIINVDKLTTEEISKKTTENAKLDAKSKVEAGKSMLEYVKGLAASKKMISSIQDVAKNPMAAAGNLGAITYLSKEMPGLLSSGSSTTSTLFKYLSANGVDMGEAKKAANGLGT